MTRLACSALVALAAIACSGNEQIQVGAGEPFRVHTSDKSPPAQFRKGPLPGTPYPKPMGTSTPAPAPAPTGDAGAEPIGPPRIIDFSTTNPIYQGQGNVAINAHASENAFSVAFALEGTGTGYWVVPVEDLGADPRTDGRGIPETFGDYDDTIPSGYRNLLAVAIDENNVAGQQAVRNICIASRVRDNFNSCVRDGKLLAPPQAVISLSWDTNVDLDLQVLTPEGRLVDPKNPVTLPADAGVALPDMGVIDRDSNAACVIDSIRTENLVWQKTMPHGTYGIYVNMFDACKQPAVRFRVEIYSAVDQGDGGSLLTRFYPRPEDPQGGILLDISANGGTARGLFVTEFKFR